ncbi:mediator of RNA polymerase II transcription subunit 15a-like isoform X2 [Phragmites australis]|uniref:mediator of RNA polymerase II transcription subunit 15a-like isoform X2 n=1 Tax=Phragmites australis TaxID=29695 RepID=UPI002D77622D|nr:mediator of RNA polymerase II transcription subunit 15a-like isoform X2 [Phragmites australis]
MDGANWRPTQGADPAAVAAAGGVDPNAPAPAGGDWRAQLQPEARSRIVNKIMETLKKHLPVSVPEGLSELEKIAVRFEEKIYTAATNQSDYLRKISLKMLSMESQTKSQQNPGNSQVIPNPNLHGPAPGLPPQGSNPAQSSAIPLMSQQQTRQPNTSTSVQASSLPSLGQSLPSVGHASTLQNMSGMPQNTMNNGLAQGATQDMYAAQRQMVGRQQQQQQAQNQLIYQQQQMLMREKLQQSSLMQPHAQQQQSLLQSTQLQSSQQPMMQMSSGLQPGQSIPQTQPMAMQSQSGIQQNPLNSVQQSVQSLLQQPTQSVVRQQQHPQSSMHQQPSLQQAQPTQQPNIPLQQQQQQLMSQQPNLQQNQLIGQQNNAVEMQQQQRLPVQSNNLLNMQQTQQMLNQQSMSLHQPQQLGSQANMSSLQQQQQQQQLLGTVPNVSNIQRMHMLQQTKAAIQQPQQQQHAQQPSMGLMQPQSQQNQLQQPKQHIMPQYQSQSNQLQQQLGMQQQPSMQQRLQTSAGMLLQQNNIDQQKQYIQAQRGLQEVSSSTSVDSTAQTDHPGAGDWQEELYQTIKVLKDQYFAELNDLYNKISMKLQYVDNHMLPQKQMDQYERMKGFKVMLERTLHFLQINKSSIQPGFREKIPVYEKQIISILNSQRRKPVQTPGQQSYQQSGGQAPCSNISQQHQASQGLQQHDNHTNQMPQAGLPNMSTGVQSSGAAGVQHVPVPQATNFGVPTTQQNVANTPQAGSNLETAQGNNFNSVQHGSMSGALQQGSTGPLQGAMNAQQQSSSNMLSHNSMSTMQPNTNSMQANASSLQQIKQQQQEHHMLQSQQMKRQMFQQLQQKQMLQQQQLQKQQQVQMQVPQLHSGNDVNELKVRQGAAMKSGIYQQVGPRGNHYPQLKQGGVFPISSPQNLQASSPQISHPSPQVDQHNLLPSQLKTGTPLHSANSPFVPSPSPPVAPSPIPVDSDKPLSNLSSLTNTGQAGHQQTSSHAPQTQSIAVNTPGISASPLLAEFTSADGSQANVPTQVPTKSSAAERPLDRLLKALRTTQHQSLITAVSDIGSVVSMIDRIAGSAPGNGSRAAVGEDLVAMTKCRLQARNFIAHDGSGTSKKMKRDTSAMPLNVSSAGSVNDSFKQSYSVDTPELQSTATSCVKWQKIEVNHALMEEIQEINQQLIDTELHVCEDDAESFAATSEGAEGTVIKCMFTAVAVSPSLKSMFASAQMSPILPLRLLVPASYPKCSPVLLDKFSDEQRNSDDLSTKAKSKFGILLRGLAEPMSLREIARTWDACASKVIAEYAQQTGGGSFSSSYGCWESCIGA